MRVIIAGGRDFGNRQLPDGKPDLEWSADCAARVEHVMEQVLNGADASCWTVVCGMAKGADELGYYWASMHGATVDPFYADWDLLGKRAGHERNLRMALAANILVAFWDGLSKGTKNMIDLALSHGLEVHVYRYDLPQMEERF
jgi:hypothetical protein